MARLVSHSQYVGVGADITRSKGNVFFISICTSSCLLATFHRVVACTLPIFLMQTYIILKAFVSGWLEDVSTLFGELGTWLWQLPCPALSSYMTLEALLRTLLLTEVHLQSYFTSCYPIWTLLTKYRHYLFSPFECGRGCGCCWLLVCVRAFVLMGRGFTLACTYTDHALPTCADPEPTIWIGIHDHSHTLIRSKDWRNWRTIWKRTTKFASGSRAHPPKTLNITNANKSYSKS